jgi:hypothetical protein
LPPPKSDELTELRASISANGVFEPIGVSAGPGFPVRSPTTAHAYTSPKRPACPAPASLAASSANLEFRLYRPITNLERRQLSPATLICIGLAVEPARHTQALIATTGYKRPMIHVADYLDWLERRTYRGDRARPPANASRSNSRRVPA